MTELPRRLDGESPEQSAIRKVRSSCPGMSLWLRDPYSHPVIWAGTDRARLTMGEFSHPHWPACSPCVDRSHQDLEEGITAKAGMFTLRGSVPPEASSPLMGVLDVTRRGADVTEQRRPSW